jgi:tetratricopeptide (TPR) repeat protein
MSRKIIPTKADALNAPRHLRERLSEASELLEQGEPGQALKILQELDGRFPHRADILGLMVNAHLDQHNQQGYLHAIHELHSLMPNRADVKLGLAGGYLLNGYMALALRTFRQFLKRWPHDEHATDVQKNLSQLEKGVGELLQDFGDASEGGYEFVCRHEELRLLMAMGDYSRGKQLAEKLLRQRSGFAPVLNNLSQIEWLDANLPRAIETSQEVLKMDADNIHALSNLTRFFFMQGKKEEASALAKRLRDSNAPAADRWVKKAEALSFIGDDDGVRAIPSQAEAAKEADQLSEMIWHWCAVAEYRRGNTAQARRYWKKSLELGPSLELANANLEELRKPAHERICPQAFSLEQWIPRKTIKKLSAAIERASEQGPDQAVETEIPEYFDQHPEFIQFVPAALASGDGLSRDFALKLADMSAHPAILIFLKEFTLGQEGPDALRLEASQVLSKHGFFKPGEAVNLWLEGKLKPVMMLGFQISHGATETERLKPAVQRLMEQAVYALRAKNGAEAERHLRKALEIQGDEPGLLNNLAVALSMQGKDEEAEKIGYAIPERFPDYFFGQVITVRTAIQAGEMEKAKTILDRMLQKQALHVTEFSVLCACQIDYLMADNKPEGALSWLEMWKKGAPEDPALKDYEARLSKIERLIASNKKAPQARGKPWG